MGTLKRFLIFSLLFLIMINLVSCNTESSFNSPSIVAMEVIRGIGQFRTYNNPNESKLGMPIMLVAVRQSLHTDNEFIDTFIKSLKSTELLECNEPINYVEMFRVKLIYDDVREKNVIISYDYKTGNEYISHNDKLYLIIDGNELNTTFIKPILNRYGDDWWSRFSDNDKNIFRYHQHWRDDRDIEFSKEIHEYKTSGFKNIDPIDVTSEHDIIERAIDEIGITPAKVYWYYDITTGYWMVRLLDKDNLYTPFEERESSSRYAYCVVMDDKGCVLETYINDLFLSRFDRTKWS